MGLTYRLVRKVAVIRERDTLPRLAYTVPEAADALGVSRAHMYEVVKRGEIRSILVGQRRVVIPVDAMEEYLHRAPDQMAVG
jgi:excisionase family DNA binding protein